MARLTFLLLLFTPPSQALNLRFFCLGLFNVTRYDVNRAPKTSYSLIIHMSQSLSVRFKPLEAQKLDSFNAGTDVRHMGKTNRMPSNILH